METNPLPNSNNNNLLYVINRSGKREEVSFDKITQRLKQLCLINPALRFEDVDPIRVAQKVVNDIVPGIETSKLDTLAAETAMYMINIHPDYAVLAARIEISNLHKQTLGSFSQVMELAYKHTPKKMKAESPLIDKDIIGIIRKHKDTLNSLVNYDRDFYNSYFGLKTLQAGYLLKTNGKIIERPQDMYMRISVGIHKDDLNSVIETYELLSNRWFTHASPTMFNAGTPCPQMSSCFLLTMKEDSIDGIYETLKRCAKISKTAGGIGLAIHDIRASQSYIRSTNGESNGLVPMLRVFNDTARYVDQGGGKRKGAFAVYLEPWHADIYEFLELKKEHGKEENRCRDLFYALWIPDLFMTRVERDQKWSLFCPDEAPGLSDVWGIEFEELYKKYENTSGLAKRIVNAQDLWFHIVESQIETGTPYMLYKDSCNAKCNQKNLGTIKCSNLCTEIIEYTSRIEVSVCNLASISLPKCIINGKFNHRKLGQITQVVVRNLDKIIDINFNPIVESKKSNLNNRPVAVGVQGLADVFIKFRIAFDSKEAAKLNKEIFETIYFAALTASKDLAKIYGPYPTYEGSPISKGILQFDMWNVTPSKRLDWDGLRSEIKKYGVRNSLVTALMPTASTAQILGNNECFEPYTSNIYVRKVLAGTFTVVNEQLMRDLVDLGLWTQSIRNRIIENDGSIQKIDEIPLSFKEIYKTVWEISQKTLIDMAAARAPWIDQSQSLNIFIAKPTYQNITSMHFYGWKKGLKTGMYYLRSKPSANATKITIDIETEKKGNEKIKSNSSQQNIPTTSLLTTTTTTNDNPNSLELCSTKDGCLSCGS